MTDLHHIEYRSISSIEGIPRDLCLFLLLVYTEASLEELNELSDAALKDKVRETELARNPSKGFKLILVGEPNEIPQGFQTMFEGASPITAATAKKLNHVIVLLSKSLQKDFFNGSEAQLFKFTSEVLKIASTQTVASTYLEPSLITRRFLRQKGKAPGLEKTSKPITPANVETLLSDATAVYNVDEPNVSESAGVPQGQQHSSAASDVTAINNTTEELMRSLLALQQSQQIAMQQRDSQMGHISQMMASQNETTNAMLRMMETLSQNLANMTRVQEDPSTRQRATHPQRQDDFTPMTEEESRQQRRYEPPVDHRQDRRYEQPAERQREERSQFRSNSPKISLKVGWDPDKPMTRSKTARLSEMLWNAKKHFDSNNSLITKFLSDNNQMLMTSSLSEFELNDLTAFTTWLEARHTVGARSLMEEFIAMKQGSATAIAYFTKLRECFEQIVDKRIEEFSKDENRTFVARYIAGVEDMNIRRALKTAESQIRRDPMDRDEGIVAKHIELASERIHFPTTPVTQQYPTHQANVMAETDPCYLCSKAGHAWRMCPEITFTEVKQMKEDRGRDFSKKNASSRGNTPYRARSRSNDYRARSRSQDRDQSRDRRRFESGDRRRSGGRYNEDRRRRFSGNSSRNSYSNHGNDGHQQASNNHGQRQHHRDSSQHRRDAKN